MKLVSYNDHSAGAKLLAEALDIKRIMHEGKALEPGKGHVVINWGCSAYIDRAMNNTLAILNQPALVSRCVNKLWFFQFITLSGNENFVPPWTTNKQVALSWGKDVVCRLILNGSEGEGIEIKKAGEPLPDAPLYVQYMKKKYEYRVHLVKLADGTIEGLVMQKKKRLDSDNKNTLIRNTANDYVFCKIEDVSTVPQCVIDSAVGCFYLTGLDFGALDVIYNEHLNTALILEVNTAPGIEGTTVEWYSTHLNKWKEVI